jgi:flagellar protein FlbD
MQRYGGGLRQTQLKIYPSETNCQHLPPSNQVGGKMIKVTRLNDAVLMVNVDRIQSLQAIPETVITFTNNDKIMVKEPLEEVSQRIVEYQRTVNSKLVKGDYPSPDFL